MPVSKQLLVLFDSHTGATQQWVEAFIWAANRVEGIVAESVMAAGGEPERLLMADGLVFACPEMLGSMSGRMKHFFDRQFYPLLGQLISKPAMLVVMAGNDGQTTVRQLERIAAAWQLRLIAETHCVQQGIDQPKDLLAPKQLAPHWLAQAAEQGTLFAEGLVLGVF